MICPYCQATVHMSATPAVGGEAHKWIIDLIHNEYDPKPSDYRPGDNWNDGAEEIADKIIGCLAQPASPLRGRESVRHIAHRHCTCTCRDDPEVLQNHTNLCDEISDAILEYAQRDPSE
jgi:hypothetical protein